ncbi:FAD-binding protein [Kribbella sp. NPDC056861]|uniref:FAD-binding oxidoreductase n=1 Tax=Kribbella sp. NPDC056861 TaxID=3154857 RepID=UPI00343E1065
MSKLEAIVPGDTGYDTARRVRNHQIDRRPAAIVRCESATDVARAVRLARSEGLGVAVRGTGSHVAGWATCDDGLLIDLGAMKRSRIDQTMTVRVGPGLCWGELDAMTTAHGLVVPGAPDPAGGIGGHTLGGGISDLSRPYGLSCDNLLSVDVVTADGDLIQAGPEQNDDLFWALRGGGGGLGVVTDFRFRLRPVRQLVAGPLVFPEHLVSTVLRKARDWLESAPPAASLIAIVWNAPALPFIAKNLQRRPGLLLLPSWSGLPDNAEVALAPLLGRPAPVFNGIHPMSYPAYRQMLQATIGQAGPASGGRAELLSHLSDDVLDEVVTPWLDTNPGCSVILRSLGAAISEIPSAATAFAHRNARWLLELSPRAGAAFDDRALSGVSLGPYLNSLSDPSQADLQAAYGANLERLGEVKKRWDPDNTFCFGPALTS